MKYEWILAIFCCLLLTTTVKGQDYLIETSFPTTGIDRFSVCGGERTISVKLTNTNSTDTLFTNTLSFGLPVGFKYVANSINVTTGKVSESNIQTPSFTFDTIVPNAIIEFTINVNVLCEGISNATGSANTTFDIDIVYDNNGSNNQNYTSIFFEVVKPNLTISKIDGVASTSPPPFDAGRYNLETTCITIANGGNGVLSNFEYWLINHPQLTLDSVTITGFGAIPVDRVSGDTTFFKITTPMLAFATPYTGPGADPNNTMLFQFNQTIDICEHWNVTGCTTDPPDIERGVEYKCQTTYACEGAKNIQGVRFGFVRPEMVIGFVEDFGKNSPACRGDTLLEHGYYITNTGQEAMANIRFSIVTDWDNSGRGGTVLDTSTIQFSTTSRNGPYFKLPIDYVRMERSQTNACFDDLTNIALINRASFDTKERVLLAPGDTLFVRYGYKVACNCGDQYSSYEKTRIEYEYRRALFGYRNEDTGADNWTTITYSDGCNLFTYQDPYLRTYSLYYYHNTRGQGPAYTSYDGDEEVVSFQSQRSLGTNAYRNDNISAIRNEPFNSQAVNFNCYDCFQEYRYIFPKGVRWMGSDGDLSTSHWEFVDNNGDKWAPTYVDYRQTSGPDTLVIRTKGRIPSGFWVSANSFYNLNYVIDCAEAGCGFYSGVPIYEEIYFDITGEECGTCLGQPDMVDVREAVPITFHCPCNPCPEGMIVKSVIAERRTFGQADNNNNTITEVGETLDTTLLNLGRVIPGDTVRVTFRGEVKTSANFPDWQYAFANIRVPSDITDFIPITANVKIWDVSTGTLYSCNVLQQFKDGQTIVTNISPGNLKTLGCAAIPNGWKYEQGDSINVEVYFMPKTNIGGNIVPKTYGIDFYVSDQDYGGTQYQCNPIDFTLQHIGYAFYWNPRWSRYSMAGCTNGYSDINMRARLGSNWDHRAGSDYFPNEVRAPFKPTTFKFAKDNDLEFTGRLLIRHYALIVSHPSQYHSLTIDVSDPYLTLLGDTLVFDYEGWYDANNNYKVSLDQGFYTHMYAELTANCATTASFSYDKFMDNFGVIKTDVRVHSKPEESYFTNNVADVRYTGGANLGLQILPNTRQTIQETTCYNIDVINPGNGIASNVFLAFESLSGGAIIKDVYETTGGQQTLLTPSSLGLYQIGTVSNGNGGTRTFEVCIQSNNCTKDSVLISTGWDCQGYPATVDEGTCNISEKVFLEPVRSELGMIISSPTTTTTSDLCEEVEYEVEISSADLGYLFDINLYFLLPPNMSLVTGSTELLYPLTGSYTPVVDATNTNGTVYRLKVSDLDPTLSNSGLPGTLDVGNNVLRVKFKTRTECNYASGSRLRFLSLGYTPCGQFANYRISPGPKHEITGAATPFVSTIGLQDAELNACSNEQTTIDISMNVAASSQAIGPNDSIRVILPEGVRYVNNSYIPINNAVSTAPSIETENGSQVIYVDLENGTSGGSSVRFSLDIEAYDIGQECRDYDIAIQAFNSQAALCSTLGGNCNVRVISSESNKSITIEKPSYEVNWVSATSVPVNADSVSLAYSVDLENTSLIDLDASTGVTIEVYNDTDGDGRFSSGDTKLGSSDFAVNLAAMQSIFLFDTITVPADQICDILTVINPETACACSEDESFLIDAEFRNIFTRTDTLCSEETTTFGPTPMNDYTYEWFGLDGANTGNLNATNTTPVQFSFTNTTENTVKLKYVVRTLKGNNCYSYDTMSIVIYPEIDEEVTTGTCAGFPVALNAPLGTTGSWFPINNLNDPNDPNTSVVGLTTTTTYTWTYTDGRGCTAYYRQTIAFAGCASNTMIGNYVWRDDNKNGIQDVGEPPLANVPVFLYDADNTTIPLATTITDVNGYYEFKPIPAGNYRVGFGNPYNYDPTVINAGSNDEIDSDMDPVTLITEPILVANGDSIPTIDAGFTPMQLIGNYVWSDLDSNGVQDVGETGIHGATVYLYKSDGTLVSFVTTDVNGAYQFRTEPGDYYIIVNTATNLAGINYVHSPMNNSGNPQTDSDINPATDQTDIFTVTAGQDRLDIDAGFNGVEDCSNGVDDDQDGLIDCADPECEPMITSLTVQIPTCIGNSRNGEIIVNAFGKGVLSYSINNSPIWQLSNTFSNLGVGQYTIRVRNNFGCTTEYASNPLIFDIDPCIEICDDGIDNDGDGLIDCNDPDCDPNIPTSKEIIKNN